MGTKRGIDSGKKDSANRRIMVSGQAAVAAGGDLQDTDTMTERITVPEGDPPVLKLVRGDVAWADADNRMKESSVARFGGNTDPKLVAWAAVDPSEHVRAAAMGSDLATPAMLANGAVNDTSVAVNRAAVSNAKIAPEPAAVAFAKSVDSGVKIGAMAGGGRTTGLGDAALVDEDPNVRSFMFEYGHSGPGAVTKDQVEVGIADPEARVAAAAIRTPAATTSQADDLFKNGATQEHKVAALECPAASEALAVKGMKKGNQYKLAALSGGGATDAMVRQGLESKNTEVQDAAARSKAAAPETLTETIHNHPEIWTVHAALSNPNTPTHVLRETVARRRNPHWVKAAKMNLMRSSPFKA